MTPTRGQVLVPDYVLSIMPLGRTKSFLVWLSEDNIVPERVVSRLHVSELRAWRLGCVKQHSLKTQPEIRHSLTRTAERRLLPHHPRNLLHRFIYDRKILQVSKWIPQVSIVRIRTPVLALAIDLKDAFTQHL